MRKTLKEKRENRKPKKPKTFIKKCNPWNHFLIKFSFCGKYELLNISASSFFRYSSHAPTKHVSLQSCPLFGPFFDSPMNERMRHEMKVENPHTKADNIYEKVEEAFGILKQSH